MPRYFILLLTIYLFASCAEKSSETTPKEETETTKISLVKKWETDTVFTTAESAIYDEKRDIIYVSNIDEGPWEEDGKGSIGQLSTSGEVINPRWIDGINAPKGLGIVGDYLYVTDLQTLIEIDIPGNKINKRYLVEEAGGLNDITTSPDGVVYVSDSQSGNIFKLENGEISQIKSDLGKSNGVLYEKDRLLIGTWQDEKLNAMSFSDNTISTVAEKLPQPDGIESDGEGGYFVSSWKGLVHYVYPDGKTELILDSTAEEIGAADLDYIQSKKMLLVPTFFHNTVTAYEFVKE